jgi:glycosyltransferase involved in cell wall biosynthesis
MMPPRPHPVQFHVLSFEGPDAYARAGGIASRICGLTQTLSQQGYPTHLWFVGDPALPPVEEIDNLVLHRWCQWISHYHPGGVYEGEEGKRNDFVTSLPPFLLRENLLPHLRDPDARAVVLAEEWHTADAVLHLDWLLRLHGVRERVAILWNANNTFGFDRVDWRRLATASMITTVSRYMRRKLWRLGIDSTVIPNGLATEALRAPDRQAVTELRQRTEGRVVLSKIARWDPDKRWLLAIDTVGELKRHGWQPLLIARGGVEAHGGEVLGRAHAAGLRVLERTLNSGDARGLLEGISQVRDVDVVSLRSPLSQEACRVLYRGADVVLANSGHEPFGLVGLEAMAAGGLACTGNTGEDYAVSAWNALVLPKDDVYDFVRQFDRLKREPESERALRLRGTKTAKRYLWDRIVQRNLLPNLRLLHAARSDSLEPSQAVAS